MSIQGQPLRILIAGGGTGGHVLPAVAVVEEIRRRALSVELLWVGSHEGVERSIAQRNDIPFKAIQTGKLRRYVSVRTVTDAIRVPIGTIQAWSVVRSFDPHVIYSTGGAVSVPTVIAGRRRPILTHEQTAQIGLANRTASRFADVFAVGFEETAELARPAHRHVVVTGNPVRSSLKTGDRDRAFAAFNLSPDLPVVYVTGGARGATPLNDRIAEVLPRLLEVAQVVHQTGPRSANQDLDKLTRRQAGLDASLADHYVVREFIGQELPDLYAITDLLVGRAGAGTVSELAAMGLPSVLVPLPGTWGDEQHKNAGILEKAGAAIVLEQHATDATRLGNEIVSLIADPPRRRQMADAARTVDRPDAAAALLEEVLTLARGASV